MAHDPNTCPTEEQLLELYPLFATSPYASGFQVWTLDVVGAGAGPYIVNVLGVGYVYPSDGTEPDATALRDAILAVMTATTVPQWVAVADGATAIQVISTQDGQNLNVTSNLGPTGAELTLVETTPLTPGDLIHYALEFASCLVCDWGCNTFEGCMAAAVHYLKMWRQGQTTAGGPSGQVVSMTQGPFSVSFGQQQFANGSDGWWGSSPEGQKFLMLRSQAGTFPVTLRGGAMCGPSGTFRRSSFHAGIRRGGCC